MKQIADKLAQYGRHGDTHIGHLTSGEVVVPVDILNNSSLLQTVLDKEFKRNNTSIERYTVGTMENSINPYTGQMEFFGLGSISNVFSSAASAVTSTFDKVTEGISDTISGFNTGDMFSIGGLGRSLALGVGFSGLSSYIAGPIMNHLGTFKALETGLKSGGIFSPTTIASFMGKDIGKTAIRSTVGDIIRGKTITSALDLMERRDKGEKPEAEQSILDYALRKGIDVTAKAAADKLESKQDEKHYQQYGQEWEDFAEHQNKFTAASMGDFSGRAVDRYSGPQIYFGNFEQSDQAIYPNAKVWMQRALAALAEGELKDPIDNFYRLALLDKKKQDDNYKSGRIGVG